MNTLLALRGLDVTWMEKTVMGAEERSVSRNSLTMPMRHGHCRRACWRRGDPTATVAESLGLPRSTAGRWVRMARQAGHLGAAEVGKAGI